MSDVIDVEVIDTTPDPSPKKHGRGGARPGAGRKPKGYVPPPMKLSYDESKARHEAAKAQLAELELRVKTRQYVSREVVRETIATAIAALAQRLRAVPDLAERRLALASTVVALLGSEIDDALDQAANQIERELGSPTEVDHGA